MPPARTKLENVDGPLQHTAVEPRSAWRAAPKERAREGHRLSHVVRVSVIQGILATTNAKASRYSPRLAFALSAIEATVKPSAHSEIVKPLATVTELPLKGGT